MRPPEFTGGNSTVRTFNCQTFSASMRPPEFTGGNVGRAGRLWGRYGAASMRPPEFTGGNGAAFKDTWTRSDLLQ